MSLAFEGFGNLRNLRNLACRLCLWHFMVRKYQESCVQVMSLAFDGFGSLRDLRNLACRRGLWHSMGSEVLGTLGVLRAGYVYGLSSNLKS